MPLLRFPPRQSIVLQHRKEQDYRKRTKYLSAGKRGALSELPLKRGSGSGTHGDPRIQQLKRNFSPGAQGYSRVQQLKGNFSSGALKAYERLTKDEKSRLEDTLHGITRKQVKLASLEIDNRNLS
ncbi:MAG: hypothetical protein AB2L14_36015 [Candidatus Xenobiia bacterium LiM19]